MGGLVKAWAVMVMPWSAVGGGALLVIWRNGAPHGDTFDSNRGRCGLAVERQPTYIHPFDDPAGTAGQGRWRRNSRKAPDVEAVVRWSVAADHGGVATVLHALKPSW